MPSYRGDVYGYDYDNIMEYDVDMSYGLSVRHGDTPVDEAEWLLEFAPLRMQAAREGRLQDLKDHLRAHPDRPLRDDFELLAAASSGQEHVVRWMVENWSECFDHNSMSENLMGYLAIYQLWDLVKWVVETLNRRNGHRTFEVTDAVSGYMAKHNRVDLLRWAVATSGVYVSERAVKPHLETHADLRDWYENEYKAHVMIE